ncbi:MAG: DUF3040 domain-containing protein [Angustibacter sp.]
MPLSEHEQRVLEQMEQAMRAEDPKFATTMRGSSQRARQRQRYLIGVVGVVAGLVLVMVGVAQSVVPVAVVGFMMMIAAGGIAATPPRRRPGGPIGAVAADGRTRPHGRSGRLPGRSGRPPDRSGSFMQRMEQRWERRRHEGQGWG